MPEHDEATIAKRGLIEIVLPKDTEISDHTADVVRRILRQCQRQVSTIVLGVSSRRGPISSLVISGTLVGGDSRGLYLGAIGVPTEVEGRRLSFVALDDLYQGEPGAPVRYPISTQVIGCEIRRDDHVTLRLEPVRITSKTTITHLSHPCPERDGREIKHRGMADWIAGITTNEPEADQEDFQTYFSVQTGSIEFV
ncbi:MAG: hypothetical protein WCT32_01870 [Patescibacteria group bacterium]|jgi:hypothetical protein